MPSASHKFISVFFTHNLDPSCRPSASLKVAEEAAVITSSERDMGRLWEVLEILFSDRTETVFLKPPKKGSQEDVYKNTKQGKKVEPSWR